MKMIQMESFLAILRSCRHPLTLTSLVCICIIFSFYTYKQLDPMSARKEFFKNEFLVNTDGCVIPKLYPFPRNLIPFIKVNKYWNCPEVFPVTYREGYRIKINQTSVTKHYSNFSHCEYVPFEKKRNSEGYVSLNNMRRKFTYNVMADNPFVTIRCFNTSNNLLSEQQYAFIIRDKTIDNIMDKRYNRNGTMRPMNILLFMFESTSRLNFVRHMDMTKKFIMNEMDAVEMLGYNKIGRNTFPNAVASLLGIPRDEMNYSNGFLDDYQFIWRDMARMGYRTMMLEDDTYIGMFQYLMAGFRKAPVLHYLFTYMRKLEKTAVKKGCYENRLTIETMLDKIAEFVQVYNDVPHFSLSMMSRHTHDNPNGLSVEDLPFLKTLTFLYKANYFENTVLMFMGDHGSRYGKVRRTHQGRLEEHLPALYFVFPKWFRKQYRHLYENLKSNSDTLINNFDVYATLQDILNIGKGTERYEYQGKYGVSLIRPISGSRTCKDLKIPTNFCACAKFVRVETKHPFVLNASKFLVSELNTILSNVSDKCSFLALRKILDVEKSVLAENTQISDTDITDFLLKIQIIPGNGFFEAEVRFDRGLNEMKLVGNILRLDKYGKQPRCLRAHENRKFLEPYCFCKTRYTPKCFNTFWPFSEKMDITDHYAMDSSIQQTVTQITVQYVVTLGHSDNLWATPVT